MNLARGLKNPIDDSWSDTRELDKSNRTVKKLSSSTEFLMPHGERHPRLMPEGSSHIPPFSLKSLTRYKEDTVFLCKIEERNGSKQLHRSFRVTKACITTKHPS